MGNGNGSKSYGNSKKDTRMKAARGVIMVTKRARARARAARWMVTATKRARATVARGIVMATWVTGNKKGNGDGNKEGNGDQRQRQHHGQWPW